MKQKLLACDVDGTIVLDESQTISKKDLESIKKFRAAGHIFALCTGRPLLWTLPLIEKYQIQTDALILCNGSDVYSVNPSNPTDTTTICSSSIPNKIGLEILKYFYEQKTFSMYWDIEGCTYEMKDRRLPFDTSVVQDLKASHVSIEEALKMESDFVCIGISAFSSSPKEAEEARLYILERWGKYIASFRNQFFVDIAALGASKGVGIRNLIQHLDKDLEVYSIGDSFNDLPMFEEVGPSNAFLMNHGETELKAYVHNNVHSLTECIDIILSEK